MLQKDMYKNVYRNIIHNTLKLETSQTSISKRKDKQICDVYVIGFFPVVKKKKKITAACNKKTLSEKYYTE